METAPSNTAIANPSCELLIAKKYNMNCIYCIEKELPIEHMTVKIGCSALAMISSSQPIFIRGNIFNGKDLYKFKNYLEISRAVCDECLSCESKDNRYGGCLTMNYALKYSAHSTPFVYCKTISTIEKVWQIIWGSSRDELYKLCINIGILISFHSINSRLYYVIISILLL